VAELPTGTVTFLFTDIEGSTRLLRELGDDYADLLAKHRRALRDAFARNGGVEVDTQGDAFFVAFGKASDALAAAQQAQEVLAEGPIRVRMGVHTGEPLVTDEGYVGIDVNRAARIAAAGHGGQILVSQSTRDLVGDGLRDLGEHRLKDLTAPERIYQLGDAGFPRLKSLNQSNLPVQPTPLIGREPELEEVLVLMRSSRLLTLTGAGGSGKTRLALQAAAEAVDEFPDGVWFVSLASLTDPQFVEPTIAQVLGARADLTDFLQGKTLLLLLDNLEQLLPGAASIVGSLDTKILATSRERLNTTAEQEYPVPTLPIEDAAALFTQRARQLKPLFEPDQHVTEIVQRLDGLPLAVELAAARVKVLTTTQILGRLGRGLDLLSTGPHDAPERQRTLRATIEWSHDLLSERERQLFECLAVFPGSFAIEAAEAICDAELDALESLVDKSLVRQTGDGRFFMLETIRAFALERLERDGAEEVRRRHSSYFYELVEEGAPRLLFDAEWLDRLEAEHDNIRATLARTLHDGEVEQLLQLLSRLWRFWSVHGHWQEGRTWLESGLSTTADVRTPERAQILEGAADLAWRQGRYYEGRAFLDESLELWRELGDLRGATGSLHFRGNLESAAGNNVEARTLWEEAQQAWRELGDVERFAATVYNLGLAALAESDDDRAVSQFEESLALARQEGLGILEALSTHSLGFALLNTHRRAEAVALLREALLAHTRLGDREAIAICLIALAEASELEGEPLRAARLLAAAEALTQEIGFAFQADLRRRYEGLKSRLVAMVGSEEFAAASAEGAELDQERAVEYALTEID